MKILAFTDEALEEQHNKFLTGEFDYEGLITKLLQQCNAFNGLKIYPNVIKRGKKAKNETKYLEMWVTAEASCIQAGGAWRAKPWKKKSLGIHRRIIKGTPKEMALTALRIIRETKKAAEIFTVLEETCRDSEED